MALAHSKLILLETLLVTTGGGPWPSVPSPGGNTHSALEPKNHWVKAFSSVGRLRFKVPNLGVCWGSNYRSICASRGQFIPHKSPGQNLRKSGNLSPGGPPRAPSEFKGDFRIELLNTVARLISLWQFPVQAGRAELKTSSQLSP